ncbi:hypothetical protein RJT34_15803 [Clitoria ternatea]|uniref:Uncharacterized protein n=1 Tax=Clitoria ternatea TaxID=43366 RepID=A0AAN9J643_CLITE
MRERNSMTLEVVAWKVDTVRWMLKVVVVLALGDDGDDKEEEMVEEDDTIIKKRRKERMRRDTYRVSYRIARVDTHKA